MSQRHQGTLVISGDTLYINFLNFCRSETTLNSIKSQVTAVRKLFQTCIVKKKNYYLENI